jgi:TM2 domain-containing membrane protein YozV/NMD protein affecting ribosome stability and mRNA decay
MNCPKCGQQIDDLNTKFCPKCGNNLQTTADNKMAGPFCRNCGKPLVGKPEICMNCGARPQAGRLFCPVCGSATNPQAVICLKCGSGLTAENAVIPGQKSKLAAGLLGIFLGSLGIHRFYLGYVGIGIVQIVVSIITLGIGGLWGFIEGILILTGTFNKDAKGLPLKSE